jgi:hypothetical protein
MAEKKKRKKSSIQSRMPSAAKKGQAGEKVLLVKKLLKEKK